MRRPPWPQSRGAGPARRGVPAWPTPWPPGNVRDCGADCCRRSAERACPPGRSDRRSGSPRGPSRPIGQVFRIEHLRPTRSPPLAPGRPGPRPSPSPSPPAARSWSPQKPRRGRLRGESAGADSRYEAGLGSDEPKPAKWNRDGGAALPLRVKCKRRRGASTTPAGVACPAGVVPPQLAPGRSGRVHRLHHRRLSGPVGPAPVPSRSRRSGGSRWGPGGHGRCRPAGSGERCRRPGRRRGWWSWWWP